MVFIAPNMPKTLVPAQASGEGLRPSGDCPLALLGRSRLESSGPRASGRSSNSVVLQRSPIEFATQLRNAQLLPGIPPSREEDPLAPCARPADSDSRRDCVRIEPELRDEDPWRQ